MLDNETKLQIAEEIDQDTIDLFYLLSWLDNTNILSFTFEDIIDIDGLYLHLNKCEIFGYNENILNHIFSYKTQNEDIVDVYVPKNGDSIFCEWCWKTSKNII